VLYSSYSLAFWFGGYLIREGELTAGGVMSVFFAVMFGSLGAGLVFPTIASLAESQAAAYKIFQVLDRVPAIDPRAGGATIADFRGELRFEHVRFAYPTRPDTALFTDLCLTVEPGTTVAFSGASGCGKSSLIALVQRLYDVDAGVLRVDGADIRDLDVAWLRDQIGVVSQEPSLFSGTIADNVRIGKPDATAAEIEDACRKANVHETVMSLPDGYDTNIGSVGSQLSGGQKQRLAIARAIIRRPKLLILDEATSALDRKSEVEVQAALDEIMRCGGVDGRKLTTLVIAHRLTTIRNVDKIHFVVCGDGDTSGSAVAESGSFDELVKLGGAFAAMVSKQQVSLPAAEDENADTADDDDDNQGGATGANGETWRQQQNAESTSSGDNAPYASKSDSFAVPVPAAAGGNGVQNAEAEVDSANVPAARIMKLAGTKAWSIAVGMLGSLIAGGLYPAFALVLAVMLEVLATKSNDEIEDQSGFWAGMFCVIGLSALLGYTLTGFYAVAGEHITERLRTQLFRNALRQDQAFFDTPGRDAGSLGKVLEGDTEAVHMLVGPSLGLKVQMACNIVAGLVIGLVYQWKVALVTATVTPLMVLAGAIQQILVVGLDDEEHATQQDVLAESLGNVRTVAAFGIAKRQCERFNAVLAADEAKGKTIGLVAGIAFGVVQFGNFGAFALSLWYGGRLIASGEATFVEVMVASTAVLMGAFGAGEAGGFAGKSADAAEAAKRVFALIDHVPAIDPLSDEGTTDFGEGCTIAFRGVKFAYPSRPAATVLSNFEDRFADGASVGLMGSTGCGKSTIIQMLGRFYDPAAGAVEINGRDLRSFDVAAWRHSVSAVLQEPSLFSGSVYDNIAYGVPEATKAEVERVARLASIHDEILRMEKGYASDVGYKGRALSGGQKQRVAIARGLLRKPRLLLLDEATSALDNATEATVMAGLSEYCREHKTTVVSVAHRLTTIQGSDKIVLLDAGVVLERGSHTELMDLGGHYARRWEQYRAGME
jgi:ATP-binding cassette subfamily B (MDR/TAP) protein 1